MHACWRDHQQCDACEQPASERGHANACVGLTADATCLGDRLQDVLHVQRLVHYSIAAFYGFTALQVLAVLAIHRAFGKFLLSS